jgi:Zn-dependent peptidase ImmA (M78 family)
LPSDSRKRWGIYVNQNGSPRRRRFTAAHELGHYLVHCQKYPDGLRCDEAAVDGRNGVEIEREANDFASTLLMPLDDFRRRIPAKAEANFDQLSECAMHYDLSLVAAILRWLRYTERRAVIVVSRDGYMNWAWSSDAALKSGR